MECFSQSNDGRGIMIRSMTGYGRESVETRSFSVTVELRSVNHRFSEMSVYLPRAFMIYEDQVKRLLAGYIRRGKVDAYVSIEGEGVFERGLRVDWNLLNEYKEALNQAEGQLSLSEGLTAGDLLQIPDVFTVIEKEKGAEHVKDALFQAVECAFRQLVDMRESEGHHLKLDLEERLNKIESSVNRMMERAPIVAESYRSRLQERMAAFLDGKAEIDEGRLMNEVAVFSDKANVEEELTRLTSHLSQFRNYLADGEAVGKKLNFLQQEMNREMNTIGAKGNDMVISAEVVEMKSELESVREQIQNIE